MKKSDMAKADKKLVCKNLLETLIKVTDSLTTHGNTSKTKAITKHGS